MNPTMNYVTVYESFRPEKIEILKQILQDNGITYRVLKKMPGAPVPVGHRLQVFEGQQEKAFQLIKENGFRRRRFSYTAEKAGSEFWIFLVLAVLIIIIIGILYSL